MDARYFLVPISHETIRSIIYISGNKFVFIPLNGQINTFTLNFVIYFGAGHFLFILVWFGFGFEHCFCLCECMLSDVFTKTHSIISYIYECVECAWQHTQKRKNQLLFEFSWILICNRFSTLLAFITFAFYGWVCGAIWCFCGSSGWFLFVLFFSFVFVKWKGKRMWISNQFYASHFCV